ncbi:cell morphogenesis N-terminal-domain-containing protein [Rhodofomes roseus]|uniref:Cell morphogenesis N-terminal-domain-containing protein n=1 Tax=Rhodofomes roseus TaxID=34475 RepID=A0ABQ8KCN0_9APHY|nr:cell morphogenesis N-terminal-domain-containing protein [Rhodofomes roseus]KAH9835250.1 cell morphogenesis N-terminal-domain-containing protein [Rhodofomes roseus]
MSDGIQITIPDFDEDDYSSTPIFGRPQGGSLWGNSSSGQDSPTILTPLALPERAEKSYFHARGDSTTSEDSVHSVQYSGRKVKSPFAHSAQASFTTNNTSGGGSSFAKKTSFASLRNAFSKKSTDPVPPVPVLDHQAYPVLKNPFNRSTSSLGHLPPVPHRHQPSHASPPQFRPPTPASTESRTRGTSSKAREHAYARSQHSQTGSIFHYSDAGSDYGGGFAPSTPPPLPRKPSAFGGMSTLDESHTIFDIEDKITMDPRTPSDYALHAIFIRFAASGEQHIDEFLRQPVDRDAILTEFMGPGVDTKLDELLTSLGKVAQKHAKPVVESVMRWRKSQNDGVDERLVHHHLSLPSGSARVARTQDIASMLVERKSLASIYIMCRALLAATQSMAKDALGEAVGQSLEELTFEQFKRPDVKLLTQSANHRINAELYARLLGQIANVRFESVTDRFLTELKPVAAGLVPKDADFKYENLVQGLKHVQIKVWPPEAFEEGADFMASLSKSFENAHGNRLKTSFAETLVYMLHPIAKTAQAEVNHPEWAKAIEVIYPRARDMMSKPRYWHVAYPLAVTALCVAPQDFFAKNWSTCLEAGLGKLKERMYRTQVLNAVVRLIWTYLYRCHEPASTTTSKLETILRHFFPANRLSITPPEEHLDPFVYMMHFVLSRHFEFGSEMCLELLQERNVTAQGASLSTSLAPERIAIASRAVLLSLHVMEREEPTPSWPSATDFTKLPNREDYPTSSEPLPSTLTLKAGWSDFLDHCSLCLKFFALSCFQTVGKWSSLDEQWSATRLSPTYEDAHSFTIRRHPEGSVAYPNQYVPHISILQTVYQSWPRCLHSSFAVEDAYDMLIRGIVHVEPAVGEAATQALQRFMNDPAQASALLSRFSAFLFDPTLMCTEGSGLKLNIESSRLVTLWITFVDQWIYRIKQTPTEELSDEDVEAILSRVDEIEAGALFLLTHCKRSVYMNGVRAVRLLHILQVHFQSMLVSRYDGRTPTSFHILTALHDELGPAAYLDAYEDMMDTTETTRLEQLKKAPHGEIALRLAESDMEQDRKIWIHVFPALLRPCMEGMPHALVTFREQIVAAASRYHQSIVQLAGVQNKTPLNLPPRSASSGDKDTAKILNDYGRVILQWHAWIKILSATAQVSDVRPTVNYPIRDHSRARSEANYERDQMVTTRDLFKYLSQFLDSEHPAFRNIAVSCISSSPARAYSQLLEDLNILAARQFYDERPKTTAAPSGGARARRQEGFHTAVAGIYYLTAHLLQEQRSSGKQTVLAHVLKYIRNMQTFLAAPEHRDVFSLQRLRRYFCGTVERLFDGLATLNDSDRFIPAHMHLSLYRLCEEWCQLGKQSETVTRRIVLMQTAAAKFHMDPTDQAESIRSFQLETRALSNAAVGAMAALCHKAFYPPDHTSMSPMDKYVSDDDLKPLHPSATLDRLTAILASFHEPNQEAGKKALRSLLVHAPPDKRLMDEVLVRAFVTTRQLGTSNERFFAVVADVISDPAVVHGFSFSQAVCLGLSNLCHPLLEIRRRAFAILEGIHQQYSGLIPLMQFEAAICSASPSAYLQAHRSCSDTLAGEHPEQAPFVLAQFSEWIPRVLDANAQGSPLILLQTLEHWLSDIELVDDTEESGLSRTGRSVVFHMMKLTSQYVEHYAEQILVMWSRLVDEPHQYNGLAVVKYLLELSPKVGNAPFISCSAKVIACLVQSVIGRDIFVNIAGCIHPTRMIPVYDHKVKQLDAEEIEEWSDFDILFSGQPRLNLTQSQFALLFLSDATLDRHWDLDQHICPLLHALFVHIDDTQPLLQRRCRHMLVQLLRCCISGFDEVADRSLFRTHSDLKAALHRIEEEVEAERRTDRQISTDADARLERLSGAVLDLIEPLHPEVRIDWGAWAVTWGTASVKREIAHRSLQLYRALSPPVSPANVAAFLGRLCSSIADSEPGISKFNVEMIDTLKAMVSWVSLDSTLIPVLFWCALACLSTTVEDEFLHTLELLDALLGRLDLDDPETMQALLDHKPENWQGPSALQPCLLTGLRASSTAALTFKLLERLSKVNNGRLIDPSEGRVRDLYVVALPCCLQAMIDGKQDVDLQEFALSICRLAEEEARPSIVRIMTSFAKSRFRTKEDFLRESVASLREHYGSEHWTNVITLLMGLVLNKEQWLRISTMQILKVLFQQRETRRPVDLLGSELLMPLLRLLETDLASQALDVLDEPMQISGGPAAKHVLRMSLYTHLRADAKEVESVAEIFGIPQESGWCVPRSDALRKTCKQNLYALRLVVHPHDPDQPLSQTEYPQMTPPYDEQLHQEDDLGEMVQNLHELSAFFKEERSAAPDANRQLEARVAAILAKSTDATGDIPQTPFADVFDVDAVEPASPYEDSDDSDYDTSSDLFEFDSPSISRFTLNTSHHY